VNERTVFITALEKEDSAQRKEYLDEVCAGDSLLRERVEALLRSHEREGRFLDVPAVEQLAAGGVTKEEIPAPADGGHSLDFLTPSDMPGSLGRLGHYDIQEVIGTGGMGIVLKAFDEKLHRVVAIKVMAAQLATSATARQRFAREAQAAAAVSHDNVVTIHAVEEADSLPYLVMQYVSGLSLQQRLDRDGPLDLPEILRIGMQTASGLAAAHAQGLVHRDIKPANILLENGVERVKITDFGLARAAAEASLTQTGVVAGTPQYMSPEQAEGKAIDQRTDLFSLGSVLYTMCTGRAPFRAGGSIAVLKRVCEEMPSPIRESRPETPEWLVEIIEKLHAKDPAERFESAAEVAELLSQHLAHIQHPSLLPLPPPLLRGTGTGRERRSGGHARRWAIAAAVFVLVFGGLSLTEATGVTRLTATVIRILTPDGTLVVEVDDPAVKVTVEGDGDLVITGTGAQEVRLRPGSYRVLATKDGKPVRDELVTITRGDKQVVKVGLELSFEAAATIQKGTGLVRIFTGHTAPVLSVAFTPSGDRIVSASEDGSVRVWDVTSGKEKQCFEGHRGVVSSLAVDPRGVWAISCDAGRGPSHIADWSVCMWEIATGKELHRFSAHGPAMMSVAINRDGRQALFANYDGMVWLYDVEKWRELRRFNTHPVHCNVRFAPNGKQMIAAAYQGAHRSYMSLWNVDTGREEGFFNGNAGVARAIFTPDGKHVVSGEMDSLIRIWDAASAAELGRLRGHTGSVAGLAISPDGRRLVSGGYDRTVRLWDLEERRELRTFDTGHASGVQSVDISPDGRFVVSGSFDSTVRLWRLRP
jgi:WD40 repeat protein